MDTESTGSSLEALQDIRNMMARSARFLSLSGWSGIWAGCIALCGAAVANIWLKDSKLYNLSPDRYGLTDTIEFVFKFLMLGLGVFILAVAGGYYFTLRKNQKQGVKMWNTASRKLIINLMIPIGAAAIFILAFIWNNHFAYIAPACLIFYGLALMNASKYTVSDIKYLGLLEVIVGCFGLFLPGWGLALWAFGFGVLHIVYGIIMWRKYDRA